MCIYTQIHRQHILDVVFQRLLENETFGNHCDEICDEICDGICDEISILTDKNQ